eukprot:m.1140660 g.1140660  ORF g.1140660 m.1140660 type:complete len:1246 (-) comp24447_c0_seq4:345-4082(-)
MCDSSVRCNHRACLNSTTEQRLNYRTGFAKRISTLPRNELEDMLLAANEETLNLKRRLRDSDEENKQLSTKIKRFQSTGEHYAAGGVSRKVDVIARCLPRAFAQRVGGTEVTSKLEDAQHRIRELERANTVLQNKLQVAKASAGTKSGTFSGGGRLGRSLKPKGGQTRQEKDADNAANAELLQRARAEAAALRDDVGRLEMQLAAAQTDASRAHDAHRAVHDELQRHVAVNQALEQTTRELQTEQMQKGLDDNVALIRVRRDARDKDKQLSAMQSKLELVQQDLKNTTARLETATQELQDKRIEIITLTNRARDAEVHHKANSILCSPVDELTNRIEQLEAENRVLQEAQQRITAAAMQGEQEKHHQRQVELLREKIGQLEQQMLEEVQQRARVQARLGDEQREHAKTEEDARAMRLQHLELRAEHERIQQKLQFFTSESAVDMAEAEEAMALVRQRKLQQETRETLSFLEPNVPNPADVAPEASPVDHVDPGAAASTPPLTVQLTQTRRELQRLSVTHTDTVYELEKTRQLLSMQSSIAADYKASVEAAQQQAHRAATEHMAKEAELITLLDTRKMKIAKLEKQIKDIAYGTRQYSTQAVDPEPEQLLGSDTTAAGQLIDLKHGENLVEVCIVSAVLNDAVRDSLDAGMSPNTFFTYDFYKHESEVTAQQPGFQPRFNEVSKYVVSMDDAFIGYLYRGAMQLDLYTAKGTAYELLATGSVKFRNIFVEEKLGANRRHTSVVQLRSATSPEVVLAEVTYWIRFRLPLDYAVRMYKERAKASDYDALNATETTTTSGVTDGGADQGGAAANTLIIVVESCSGLVPRRPDIQPSAYVAYALPGFADHRSATVTSSCAPVFGDTQRYDVAVTPAFDTMLQTASLGFLVVDDDDPDLSAFIGGADLNLEFLRHGPMRQHDYALNLTDEQGNKSGVLHMRASWERPYVIPGQENADAAPSEPRATPGSIPNASSSAADVAGSSSPPIPAAEDTSANAVATDAKGDDEAPDVVSSPVQDTDGANRVPPPPPVTQPAVATGGRTDQALASVGRVIVERVQIDGGVAPTVQRVFVCCSAGWLQPRYYDHASDVDNPLQLLETPDSVPRSASGMVFNHSITLLFDPKTSTPLPLPSGVDSESVLRGALMHKMLRKLAKEIVREPQSAVCFEVIHEPDDDAPGNEECVPLAVGFIDVKAEVWARQHDVVSAEVPLYDYDKWYNSDPPQSQQLGSITVSIELLKALETVLVNKALE